MYPELAGQYVLGKTIGSGGFGKVKVATHVATGEKVAIKIMNKEFLKDDMPRVYQEIQAMQSLAHRNICQLYQVVESKGHVFLIMEYCSGGELFDYIIHKEKLPEEEARIFFRQIVAAVSYCHCLGFAHRDLKPENILLDNDQNLKIVDFGLCVRPLKGIQLLTSCGSPNYAAPELLRGLKYFGPQIDIWSLGVLLYALLCGNLPFEAEVSERLYAKILSGRYGEPTWLSVESRDLIRSLLKIDPSQRLTTEQLRDHPWLNNGFEVSVKSLSVGGEEMHRSEDCLRVMAAYLNQHPTDVWAQLVNSNSYDYTMATYRILLQRKKNKLPLRKLRRPLAETGPRDKTNILSPEAAKDNGCTYVVMKKTYVVENKRKALNSPGIDENAVKISETPVRERSVATPGRSAPIGSRRASKRIRSPGLGDREPIPKKMVSRNRSPISTPIVSQTPRQKDKTPSSARRMLSGFERGIRQVLTPRRSLPRNPGQPVVLGSKNMINVTSTNSTDPGHILALLKAALEEKGISCSTTGFTLCGKVHRRGIGNQQQKVSFELEVCWLPPATQKAVKTGTTGSVVGIRRKRLKGDAWIYKCVCEEVLAVAAAV